MNETLLQGVFRVLRKEGIGWLIRKIFFRVRYLTVRFFNPITKEQKRWDAIKGKHAGKRAFLIGNGPSLNKTPLHLLKNEYTINFNRFYIMAERLNWYPKLYMCVDNLVLDDLKDEIDDILEDSEYGFFPDIHTRMFFFKKQIKPNNKIYWLAPIFGRTFSLNLPNVNQGATVIYDGLQVLNHLGFDEIYMIGVDMNFQIHKTAKKLEENVTHETDIVSQKDDDPNHFDPRYFGKNRKYHQPEKTVIDTVISRLNNLAQNMSKYGLNIKNAGYDSKLESFPKVDFRSLFNYTEEEEEQLFLECVQKHIPSITSEKEFLEKYPQKDKIGNWKEEHDSFWMDMDKGLKNASKSVFTHVPIGPFDNKYFFIKRETSQN